MTNLIRTEFMKLKKIKCMDFCSHYTSDFHFIWQWELLYE